MPVSGDFGDFGDFGGCTGLVRALDGVVAASSGCALGEGGTIALLEPPLKLVGISRYSTLSTTLRNRKSGQSVHSILSESHASAVCDRKTNTLSSTSDSPADMTTLLDLTITDATSCNGLALLLRDVGVGRLAEGEAGTFETLGANSLFCVGSANTKNPYTNPQINSFSNSW